MQMILNLMTFKIEVVTIYIYIMYLCFKPFDSNIFFSHSCYW